MSKELKWDKSESYVVNYHNGRQDAYYVLQVAFYNGKQDFEMETDIFGYYLLVCNVPNFNPKTNELGEADIEYSDLRLLVPCSRRGEKSFKLALDMMDKEARESIEVMEEDKIFLEEIAKENDIDVEEMKNHTWGMIVVDEAQNIKNPDTAQTLAIKTLKSDIKIAMTVLNLSSRFILVVYSKSTFARPCSSSNSRQFASSNNLFILTLAFASFSLLIEHQSFDLT